MEWATTMITEERVTHAMKRLHPDKYQNLITNNGSQFSRKNSNMRHYCEGNITGAHTWASVHHPQTMGKLSNMQKGLKRFLRHRLGDSTDMHEIDRCIEIYLDFYNNAPVNRSTGSVPVQRYSNMVDEKWYSRLIKALKLQSVLSLDHAPEGVT